MRWAADLEDPEIAADADFDHLERAIYMHRLHRAQQVSPHRRDETASAGPSGRRHEQEAGRGGMLPTPGRGWRWPHPQSGGGLAGAGGGLGVEPLQPADGGAAPAPPPSPSPPLGPPFEDDDDDEFDDDDDDDDPPPTPDEDRLESAKLLAAGGIAGAVSKTATAPLARLTILYQVQGTAAAAASPLAGLGLGAAMRAVVARDGLAALWRGNGVTIVHRLPYSAVNFWAYEKLTAAWIERGWGGGWAGGGGPGASGHGGRPSDTIRRLACGGGAGLAACALAYPLDLVRTRLAAQMATSTSGGLPPAGISGTLRGIISAEGARGLYRGLGATLAQVAPALAINYSVYGRLRAAWMEGRPPGEPPTIAMSLVCGAAAGLASSTATFPLDLVRRRMQVEGAGRPASAPGAPTYASVARSVWAARGLRGFYSGLMPEYYKVAPGVAIGFCTYELCREVLGVRPGLAFR